MTAMIVFVLDASVILASLLYEKNHGGEQVLGTEY
jgi:hypothetical protein